MVQLPTGNFLGVKKPQGLLRLGFGLRGELGPDPLPVVREHLAARHQAAGCNFNGGSVSDRDRSSSVGPAAYVWGVCADSLGQRRLAAALLGKVGFDVHDARV